MSGHRRTTALGFLFTLFFCFLGLDLHACNCAEMERKYQRMQDDLAEALATGNTVKENVMRQRIWTYVDNWKPMEGCPPPVLPESFCVWRTVPPGGGPPRPFPGGRTIGGGLVTDPGTDTVKVQIFMRNHDQTHTVDVKWTVFLDSTAPAGACLLDSMGTVTLPPLRDTVGIIVCVRVKIPTGMALGSSFKVVGEVMDLATGLLWKSPIEHNIQIAEVEIEPLDLVAPVPPIGSFGITWRVHNPNPFPVTKTWSFVDIPDPGAVLEMNDGTPYTVSAAYPTDKAVTGGSATIAAGGFIDIFESCESAELCEVEMIGCKGLEIDGMVSCIPMPNDPSTAAVPAITSEYVYLEGNAMGGFVQIDMPLEGAFITVPTFPGQPIEQILDALTQDGVNQWQNVNNFPVQPMVGFRDIAVIGRPGTLVSFLSFDPGLVFNPGYLLSPAWEAASNITSTSFEVNWANDPGVVEYLVEFGEVGGPVQAVIVPGAPALLGGLNPDTDHWWQVTAVYDPFGPVVSLPSYPDSLRTAAPCSVALPPQNPLSTEGVSTMTLSWDPVAESVGCQVEGTRLTPPGPSGSAQQIGYEVSSITVPLSALGSGTTWAWAARCACSISPLTVSTFSVQDTFTTSLLRQIAPPAEARIYPNPAREFLTLEWAAPEDLSFVNLVDAHGLQVRTWTLPVWQPLHSLDLQGLPAGPYILHSPTGWRERIYIMD